MTRILALTTAALALFPALAAEARQITGEMAYRERIALVEGALYVVELRGPEGVVAEARVETTGQQVPLPFALTAPDAGAYTLRGAIFLGGQAQWVTDPVAVAAGEEDAALGLVPLARPVALGLPAPMACGSATVGVALLGDMVRLTAGGESFDLTPVEAASGARYSNGATPETVFWSRGNAAMVTVKGVDLGECAPEIGSAFLPLTARGNEPFWTLQLAAGGFVYEGNMGATRLEGPMPAPVATETGARFDVSESFGFAVEPRLCRDSMAGMPHPLTVTVTENGAPLPGCGGAPADLLSGAWVVEEVTGATMPEGAEVSLVFDTAAGRVYGKGGCNRFNGGFTLTGEGLGFGPAASTMMACPDDLMALEGAYLRGLETVDRFDITDAGALELYSGATVFLRARR